MVMAMQTDWDELLQQSESLAARVRYQDLENGNEKSACLIMITAVSSKAYIVIILLFVHREKVLLDKISDACECTGYPRLACECTGYPRLSTGRARYSPD